MNIGNDNWKNKINKKKYKKLIIYILKQKNYK